MCVTGPKRPKLPDSVQEIVDVIGYEKTRALITYAREHLYRGARSWRVCFYVPRFRMPLDHWLVRLLGYQDAERMRREFGGLIMQPSNLEQYDRQVRNEGIKRRGADGETAVQIARHYQLTPRRVSGILSENPPEASNDAEPDIGTMQTRGRK